MVDLRLIEYRVVAVTPQGEQLDITPATTDLGWEEGEKEYAARISLKLHDSDYNGQRLSQLVQPMTPIIIYAIANGESREVIRGNVTDWIPTDSNSTLSLDLTAYDEMKALRENRDDEYIPDGMTTKQIFTNILSKWGVPYDYKGPEVMHHKMAFRKKPISDMLKSVLKDVKDKGGGVYFMRAREGKIEVIPRGSNEETYHFDAYTNMMQTRDSFSTSGIVTRVKVVGQMKDEGIPPVEEIVDGHTEYGIRQTIIERPKDKSLYEVRNTANQILKEKGQLKRKTTLSCADVPYIRKGDRIRVESGTLQGYWFITAIRHNAQDETMNLSIVEDKEKNAEAAKKNGTEAVEYDTGDEDEEGGEGV